MTIKIGVSTDRKGPARAMALYMVRGQYIATTFTFKTASVLITFRKLEKCFNPIYGGIIGNKMDRATNIDSTCLSRCCPTTDATHQSAATGSFHVASCFHICFYFGCTIHVCFCWNHSGTGIVGRQYREGDRGA